MLTAFFYTLRAAKLPVSVNEYLTLLEALRAGVIDDGDGPSVDKFYFLARTALVKDEAHYDKFDRAFAAYFKGVELVADFTREVPLEWLKKTLELELSPEEKAAIEKMGWQELMDTLRKRFEEQKERHAGQEHRAKCENSVGQESRSRSKFSRPRYQAAAVPQAVKRSPAISAAGMEGCREMAKRAATTHAARSA